MEKNIDLLTDENEGGGFQFLFTRVGNLAQDFYPEDLELESAIALKTGSAIYSARFLADDLSFNEASTKRNGDDANQVEIKCVIHKDSIANRRALKSMRGNRYIVSYESMNGDRLILGNMEQGCMVDFSITHGNTSTANSIILTIKINTIHLLPTLNPLVVNPFNIL